MNDQSSQSLDMVGVPSSILGAPTTEQELARVVKDGGQHLASREALIADLQLLVQKLRRENQSLHHDFIRATDAWNEACAQKRAIELSLEGSRAMFRGADAEVKHLSGDVLRLTQALEFYADPESWARIDDVRSFGIVPVVDQDNCGDKARAALAPTVRGSKR
jgi:hypothetical protein